MHSISIIAGIVSFASTASMASGDGISFQPLGFLGVRPDGFLGSSAWGLSADGTTVVGYSASPRGDEAFRWTAEEGMVGLGDLPGNRFYSEARDISADGSVIVGRSHSTFGTEAFRWTAAEGMVGLGAFSGGSLDDSFAWDASDDGTTIVGYSRRPTGSYEAFRWTAPSGMVGLGYLPGGSFLSGASAVSADGAVIAGNSSTGTGTEAFRWTEAEGMVGLGLLPGVYPRGTATAVSADGELVVGSQGDVRLGTRAFRWTSAEGMVDLGALPGETTSAAFDVTADGRVIVGASPSRVRSSEAMIWDESNGMRRLIDILEKEGGLVLNGWHLSTVNGVSADGLTLIGGGTNPEGKGEAWIARLPEPGALGLMAIGGTFLLRSRHAEGRYRGR